MDDLDFFLAQYQRRGGHVVPLETFHRRFIHELRRWPDRQQSWSCSTHLRRELHRRGLAVAFYCRFPRELNAMSIGFAAVGNLAGNGSVPVGDDGRELIVDEAGLLVPRDMTPAEMLRYAKAA